MNQFQSIAYHGTLSNSANAPKNVLLIGDPDTEPTPAQRAIIGGAENLHWIDFHEVEFPGCVPITHEMIEGVLDWNPGSGLVACPAGVCRSPTLAYILNAADSPVNQAISTLDPTLHVPMLSATRIASEILDRPMIHTSAMIFDAMVRSTGKRLEYIYAKLCESKLAYQYPTVRLKVDEQGQFWEITVPSTSAISSDQFLTFCEQYGIKDEFIILRCKVVTIDRNQIYARRNQNGYVAVNESAPNPLTGMF